MMPRWKLITLVVLVFLAVVIVWQNRSPVATKILFVTVTMPLAVLLFITVAMGFVAGVMVGMGPRRRR